MRGRFLPLRIVAVAAVQFALCGGALAAQIGEAASVIPASSFTRGSTEKTLAIRDALEQNDRIRTTGRGSTQVRFLDDTLLTIGPDSEVLLDQFVFDGNRAQKATVEVVKGAMRFVSGTSDRRAYEIKTPVATIGVRGTVVDIGFVNGRWSFNPVDGTITATLKSNGETRTFNAGQPGFSIGPSGFVPINPNDAGSLGRRLDTAHQSLAKSTGTNPSAPQGAAAGNQGDNTGSTGQGGQGQGGQGGTQQGGAQGQAQGGPGAPGSTYTPPPSLNVITTTGSTTGGATGGTPVPPPAFTANPLSFLGVGGSDTDADLNIAPNLNRALMDLTSVVWDTTDGAAKSVTLKGTTAGVPDPNAVTIERTTARIADLYTDPSSTPLYQIGRWTDGRIVVTQNNATVIDETLTPQQGLHYIIFGHTNGLYDSSNQFEFGKKVTYQLERATSPTWINSQGAPGTFTGQVAVAFSVLAVSYGLEAQLAMPGYGTINIQTPGGLANPELSGAVGSSVGGLTKSAFTFLTATGGPCATPGSCFGGVDFIPVASTKIGVFYSLDVPSTPNTALIEGAAVFGSPGTPADPVGLTGKPVGSFADAVGVLHLAVVQGVAEISGSLVHIKSFTDGIQNVVRQTASSLDAGNFLSIGWERWSGGTYQVTGGSNPGTVTLPADGGVHMIHGVGATIPAALAPGLNVQYSLAGGTLPTLSDGTLSPGTLGANSKLGVDFSSNKIGADLFVNIGTANYHMSTSGGAATPANSSITFNSSGVFAGSLSVALASGTQLAACPIGNCNGGMAGFLSNFESSAIGLTYAMGNSSSQMISGAAAFGRDFPVSSIGAFGYADPLAYGANPITVGPTQDFNSSSQNPVDLSVVADNTKASGLSVQSFNLEINTNATVFGWHRLSGRTTPDGSSVDQGVIAGVLGWERLIGTLHQHTNSGGGLDIVLTADQGVHILHGVRATNIPTNQTYTYNLTGGTSPTVADGSSAPGQILNGSQVGVNFSTSAPKFGVNLNVDMQTAGNAGQYNIQSSGGAAAPSLAASSLHSNGTFNAAGIATTHTGGTNVVCTTACTGAVSGILAGDQAKHLGIVYQFGNASNPSKVVTGAAGFTRP